VRSSNRDDPVGHVMIRDDHVMIRDDHVMNPPQPKPRPTSTRPQIKEIQNQDRPSTALGIPGNTSGFIKFTFDFHFRLLITHSS